MSKSRKEREARMAEFTRLLGELATLAPDRFVAFAGDMLKAPSPTATGDEVGPRE